MGDCYVAVAGFPDPQPDHAVRICRFAADCIRSFNTLVSKLEVTLGPDTGDLGVRVGIHSGQVTAGVLRGDRARFQLFGDTMNVWYVWLTTWYNIDVSSTDPTYLMLLSARMESSSKCGKVHVSRETANHLVKAGKQGWLRKRSDTVVAKGKGSL